MKIIGNGYEIDTNDLAVETTERINSINAEITARTLADTTIQSQLMPKGGGTNKVFFENDQTVTEDYTITFGKNAIVAGPISIEEGNTVTIPEGSVVTIPGVSNTFAADGSVPMTGDLQLGNNQIVFEGTVDDYETTLDFVDPTADRTITLPDASGTVALTSNILGGFKNKIINGRFQINQRVYASGATLAAGAYGHDRWKAGASGGDYSFTQNAADTTITIASGKSLIQVIEDANVSDTAFVLSWSGTAQARYAVNSATPAGSYAASPIVITGQTVGTTMSVEFNEGTLGDVQLEAGSVATPFEARSVGAELALCQRYYYRLTSTSSFDEWFLGWNGSATVAYGLIRFPVAMRDAPTALQQTGTATDYRLIQSSSGITCSSTPTFVTGSITTSRISYTVAAGLNVGYAVIFTANAAGAYLAWSAEL